MPNGAPKTGTRAGASGAPPPQPDWSWWGGVCLKSVDDVNFTFTVPAGAIDVEGTDTNLAVAVDVPPFSGKEYPVPGAMYAFTLTLGPDSSTTILENVRCSIDYPEYMLAEYGGLGESSLRAYRYDYINMDWELLAYGETSIHREHHIISR